VNDIHEFPGQGTLESSRLPDFEHSVVTWSVFVIGSALTCVFLGKYHSPHTHPTSQVDYVIAHDHFYQAFPSVSSASDKCWGTRLDQWCTCLLYCCTLSDVSSCLTMGAIEIRILPIACSQQLHSGITFDFYMRLSHVCVGVLPNKNICLPYFSLGKHRTHK